MPLGKRPLRWLLGLSIAVMSGCSSAPERPEHPVGRVARHYSDAERPSWTGSGPRPIVTTIWYPAAEGSREAAWNIDGLPGAPVFRAGWSAADATLADSPERFPLIVLSHGTGGASAQLAWLGEFLASQGYLAAAVNHHGNTAYEPTYQPRGFVLWWERALDLRVALDELLRDETFGPRIDASRIGAAGFSLGGYTVLALAGARVDIDQIQAYCREHPATPSCDVPPEAPYSLEDIERLADTDLEFQKSMTRSGESYRDSRVRAVYAIAPVVGPALTRESLAEISLPTRIVVGTLDTLAPPETNARAMAGAIPDAQLRLLPGVGHYSFLAECGLSGSFLLGPLCADPDGVDRAVVHRDIARDALRFLDGSM